MSGDTHTSTRRWILKAGGLAATLPTVGARVAGDGIGDNYGEQGYGQFGYGGAAESDGLLS